jgi:hypothetical protein
MVPKKNGVYLETKRAGNQPYMIFACDLWECPNCHFELITGLGKDPVIEHFIQPKYNEVKTQIQSDNLLYEERKEE